MNKLNETAEQVAALIPRFSWQLMDEEQRDDLMVNVVLPRHGEVTADGVTLTYAWWGDALGATKKAVEGRILRLRARMGSQGPSSRAEPNSRAGRAAATLRDPDKAAAVLEDPEVRAAVRKALDQTSTQDKVEQVRQHLNDPDVATAVAADRDIRTSFTKAQQDVADDLDARRETDPTHRSAKRSVERTRALEAFLRFRITVKALIGDVRRADFGDEWRETVVDEARKTRDAIDMFIDLASSDPDPDAWDRALAALSEGGDR